MNGCPGQMTRVGQRGPRASAWTLHHNFVIDHRRLIVSFGRQDGANIRMWRMSSVDHFFIELSGKIAGRSPLFDRFFTKFLSLSSIKLLPLMLFVVYLWFRGTTDSIRSKRSVVESIVSMFISLLSSRLVQDFMPMRLRPIHSGDPTFNAPFGVNVNTLEHWSSFPSDHAAMVFALSTSIAFVSRPLGVASYLWSICIVSAPRVYSGYHYASDVMGGALVGVAVALMVHRFAKAERMTNALEGLDRKYAGHFNAVFFAVIFLFTTMFDDIRSAFAALLK